MTLRAAAEQALALLTAPADTPTDGDYVRAAEALRAALAAEQPDDRPTWNVPHSVTIRCLRAAEDRIRAGESPADVWADYGWTFALDAPAEQPQPVARVMVHRTGGNAGIAWSAVAVTPGDSLPLMPNGTMLYAAPPPPPPAEAPTDEQSPPEAQPVAWIVGPVRGGAVLTTVRPTAGAATPLYAAPPPSAPSPSEAQDAARYRWLRGSKEGVEFRDGAGRWRADCPSGADLDAAIDAALKAREGR